MISLPMRRGLYRTTLATVVVWLGLAAFAAAQTPTREEMTIYVNEVTTWSPGYAMGDIVLGSPTTAGYEPTNGRRQLMLRGKVEGRTTLNIWDQKKVLRHEIALVVTTRQAEELERDLKKLLEPYPNVQLTRIGSRRALTGTVASEQELATLNGIASVAGVQSTVQVVARGRASGSAGAGTGTGTGTGTVVPGTAGTETRPGGEPPVEAEPDTVEYELELFEASSQFKTASYGSGVEPSGRSLYKGKVSAPIGGEGTTFIGGLATDPKKRDDKQLKETGIRLTVRPRAGQRGALVTAVEVETNVPLEYNLYDPEVWRRSRYQFATSDGVPFAVSGNDLLAAPAIAGGMSAMGKAQRGASAASSVPGASSTGLQFVPVFGSLFGSNNYKSKRTQILVVFRPTLTTGAR
jgi:hypothetical protein